MVKCDDTLECVKVVLFKFFTLIVAGGCGVGAVVYMTGVVKYVGARTALGALDAVNLVGCVSSTICAIFYAYLFFVARKPYRLMYFLSAALVFSLFFTGHSLGLTGPTVFECAGNWSGLANQFGAIQSEVISNVVNGSFYKNQTISGDSTISIRVGDYNAVAIGCLDTMIIFSGALIAAVFGLIAVFDVQRILLKRVRAKTYGERFSEMGIK